MIAARRRSVVFLLASARRGGNSETLARRAARGLGENVVQTWLRLAELPLPPFEDLRHAGAGTYPEPTGHERTLLDATLAATDIVVVSPLYWYALSASAKLYLDYWTAWLRVPGAGFRERMEGKALWGITTHTSGDDAYADAVHLTLRHSANFLQMRWCGLLLVRGGPPDAVRGDRAALRAASSFLTADVAVAGP